MLLAPLAGLISNFSGWGGIVPACCTFREKGFPKQRKKNKDASNEQSGTQPGKLRTWRCRKKVKIHHRRNATQAINRPAF
jgi:hypothetical protein